jgi:hypothetical protein
MRVGPRPAAGASIPTSRSRTSPYYWEQLQAIWVGDPKCGSELRQLHLTLFLGSLHTLGADAEH